MYNFCGDCGRKIPEAEEMKRSSISIVEDVRMPPMHRVEESATQALRRKRHSMSHALHPALQVLIALLFLAILIWPNALSTTSDLDANEFDRNHIP